MNRVNAIKNLSDISCIINKLWELNPKVGLIFSTGLSLAIRISDILLLTYNEFFYIENETLHLKNFIKIYEKKNKKFKNIPISLNLKNDLLKFLEFKKINAKNIDLNEFVFINNSGNKPISRQYVSRIFKKAQHELYLDFEFNTHSMRKTWGYFAYDITNKDIVLVMEALNHCKEDITKRYIDITELEVQALYAKLNL
ncbi:Phage integrase family protein [Peptoniphilus asaccharolyticus DSM 20463]|uniref:Phage integrase family protein n=1 Tax=Peptoniphilus asaccharolyticus DSM 20463 TaxID=573058 RepID=A0A1W1UCS9_PEPAS|nr:tyrosine-type recombinase/integrase [Peptoniphilus asaccharolyticus]MBL7576429.1 tyrosine-type recombinase/integrase [Peptoniphilus asaccharolyticus]SMB78604.1 Phage integrase family protein [Peptoniphilus asaccharolyticus DSM 20463]